MSVGNFGFSEGNITGRENKQTKSKNPTECALNCNYKQRQRSGTDVYICHQQVGAGQGRAGCIIVLRIRTGSECPEDNLRELMWDCNPNCGVARGQEKRKKERKKERDLSHEGSNPAKWSLVHSQNKELSKYQRRANWLPHRVLLSQRRRGRHVTARTGRQWAAALSAPESSSSIQLWAGSQLLTTSSCDPGWLTSARSVTTWEQFPRRDTSHTWDGALVAHLGNQAAGTREVIRCTAHPGQCTHQAPGWLSCLDPGWAQNAQSIWVCDLLSTREPERLRPGKCTTCRAHLGQCPCRAAWSLSSGDLGSTRWLGLWQTQCGPSTESAPHIWQQYLFVVSLSPHNTTEQVSLNKWPASSCVRVEIRYGRDLQTEEAKINKERGTTLEVTGATD